MSKVTFQKLKIESYEKNTIVTETFFEFIVYDLEIESKRSSRKVNDLLTKSTIF